MRMIAGRFNGTGAALYLCFGFVPDFVRIYAPGASNCPILFWNRHMSGADAVEGVLDTDGNTAHALQTGGGNGIRPYYGGDEMTSTNQTSTAYGEGVFLAPDDFDYRKPSDENGDAVSDLIDSWDLDTSGDRTGHFNEDVNGTYVGEGSRIVIDGKVYAITSLTASQGEAADEVELNYAAPSGDVEFISGKYTMKPLALGEVSPAGIYLAMTTPVNANDDLQVFEAGVYDG